MSLSNIAQASGPPSDLLNARNYDAFFEGLGTSSDTRRARWNKNLFASHRDEGLSKLEDLFAADVCQDCGEGSLSTIEILVSMGKRSCVSCLNSKYVTIDAGLALLDGVSTEVLSPLLLPNIRLPVHELKVLRSALGVDMNVVSRDMVNDLKSRTEGLKHNPRSAEYAARLPGLVAAIREQQIERSKLAIELYQKTYEKLRFKELLQSFQNDLSLDVLDTSAVALEVEATSPPPSQPDPPSRGIMMNTYFVAATRPGASSSTPPIPPPPAPVPIGVGPCAYCSSFGSFRFNCWKHDPTGQTPPPYVIPLTGHAQCGGCGSLNPTSSASTTTCVECRRLFCGHSSSGMCSASVIGEATLPTSCSEREQFISALSLSRRFGNGAPEEMAKLAKWMVEKGYGPNDILREVLGSDPVLMDHHRICQGCCIKKILLGIQAWWKKQHQAKLAVVKPKMKPETFKRWGADESSILFQSDSSTSSGSGANTSNILAGLDD